MEKFMENWSGKAKNTYDSWPDVTKKCFTYPFIKNSFGKKEFDIVIVGGGPNGLVAGCYLARAGLRVAITDRRTELGGAVTTEELRQPRFKHNVHAIYMPMVDYAPVYNDLELERHQLEHIFPDVQFAMSFADGSSLCIYNELERTCKSMEQFSKKDADTYREFYRRAQVMMDEFIAPSTYVQPMPAFDQLRRLANEPWHKEMSELQETSPKQFVDEMFESDKVKALVLYTLCMWGMDPLQGGVGYLIPLYVNRASNYRLVVHGSHVLTASLTRDFMSHGGKIFSPYGLEKIVIEDGEAKGVQLSGGPFIEAKMGVVSTIDPQQTFLKYVGEEHLETDFVESTQGWQWEHWTLFGVHMCLLDAPQFTSAENNPDVEKALIHVVGYESAEDFINHQEMIAEGEFNESVGFNCCFPTIHDHSQAPLGKHTGLISCMAPYNLNEGNEKWLRLKFKEEKAWMLINKLAKYAPNITEEVVRDIYASSPADVSNKFLDMIGGSIKQGQYHPLQMGYLRPNEFCSTHRSPIKNLFMGGACTYPGGTVLLGSGYLAADAVAEENGIEKWWQEPDYVKAARAKGFFG